MATKRQQPQQNERDEQLLDFKVPDAIQHERNLLGMVLSRPEWFYTLDVSVDDFVNDANRKIFAAMNEVTLDGNEVSFETVGEKLKQTGQLEVSGGFAYISGLTNGVVATVAQLRFAQEQVRDMSRRRRLFFALNKAAGAAIDQQTSLEEVVGALDTDVTRLVADDSGEKAKQLDEIVPQVWDYLEALRNSDRETVGLPSAIRELGDCTTGYRDGEYTIVAGWPGTGKSAFALQEANENAERLTRVAYFSAEMDKLELTLRLLAQRTGINYLCLRSGSLTREQRNTIAEELKVMRKLPIMIDDTPSLTSEQLIARSRRFVAKGAKLIIYDYIQKFRVRGERDPRLVINGVSEALREFAKSSRTPIVVLSQLARPKDGARRRPTIFDLKESGNLEQDAHVVLLLYRPVNTTGEYTRDDAIIIGKQRSGPTGDVNVSFYGETLQFKFREYVPKESKKKDEAPLLNQQRNVTGEKDE